MCSIPAICGLVFDCYESAGMRRLGCLRWCYSLPEPGVSHGNTLLCKSSEKLANEILLLPQPSSNDSRTLRTATDVDQRLIDSLRANGRAMGRSLAKGTGLSEATVSRRLAALSAAGLVHVRGYIDPFRLGCSAVSMFRFASTGSPEGFAAALALRSAFYRVATITGRNEVVALCVASDAREQLAELDAALTQHPDVSLQSVTPVTELIPPKEARTKVTRPATRVGQDLTPRQSVMQARLLRALQRDFRATFQSIAASSELSAPAVSLAVADLISQGVISHIVVSDPHFVRRPLHAQFRIAVRREIVKTAWEIAARCTPDWVFFCLGPEPITIEGSFAHESELVQCQRAISAMEHVASVTTSQFAVVHKQTFDWYRRADN
ncbi:MAG: AsnC family transcriptional regulator [Phycisphaerales bacterium]|nr:AsnC family transcriptional regulator [Phycisphaerales bacterium]